MNPLFREALEFFGLGSDFDSDDLKKRYHALALKYHPDRGEYTSDVLFVQLLHYKSVLEEILLERMNTVVEDFPPKKKTDRTSSEKSRSDYEIYKTAKKIENDAILQYFHSRKNNLQMELSIEKNPELKILLTNLEKAKALYELLLKDHPSSIWIRDAKDSLESMKVWWNYT